MKLAFLGLAALGLGSAAVPSAQAVITINNPSFEAQVLADGVEGPADDVTGWTVDRGYVGATNLTAAQFSGEASLDGANVLAMNSGILHQDLGTMVAGTTYQFDIAYGTRNDIPQFQARNFAFILRPDIGSATAYAIAQSATFSEASPSTSNITLAPQAVDGSGNPIPGFLNHAILSYTATASDNGQPLTLQLQVQAGDLQLDVDRVTLTTTLVPEPATIATAAAAIGLLARRRRA